MKIWNHVIEEGVAFPQKDLLTEEIAMDFFKSQTYTGVAWDEEADKVIGMYILHPNNLGRCGHICNAVVKSSFSALKLYKKLGFTQLGTIPGGFCNKQGVYEDIIPHYIELI